MGAAGTGGIMLQQMVPVHVWMPPHCQTAQAAPAAGESNEPSHLFSQGTTDLGQEEGCQGAPGNTQTHSGPVRHLVLSLLLGSSHDPLQSRALSQVHLFIWQRWWVQSIPSECLKSLLRSPLPLQRLQEVRRNLDSASTKMVSDSILRKPQGGSLGAGIAAGRRKPQ